MRLRTLRRDAPSRCPRARSVDLPAVRYRTRGEKLAYLTRQGVIPPEWSDIAPDFAEAEAEEEPGDPAEDIVREIVGTFILLSIWRLSPSPRCAKTS